MLALDLEVGEAALVLDLDLAGLLLVLQLSLGADPAGIGGGLGVEDVGLADDGVGDGAGLGLGGGGALGLDLVAEGLELDELGAGGFGEGVVGDALALELALGLLLLALGFVAGAGLLGLGGDLDGELDGLHEGVAGAVGHGLHRLDVDVGDTEAVGGEGEAVLDGAGGVAAKDGLADQVGAGLVEEVKGRGGDDAADAAGHGLAAVADKVGHGEEAVGGGLVGLVDLEVPVVGELELQAGVGAGLDGDDVGP